jgi:alcohol dehydrogenase (NADP+)
VRETKQEITPLPLLQLRLKCPGQSRSQQRFPRETNKPFCVANNIYPQVEVISVRQLDETYQKVLKGEVKFRYVLAMSTLK